MSLIFSHPCGHVTLPSEGKAGEKGLSVSKVTVKKYRMYIAAFARPRLLEKCASSGQTSVNELNQSIVISLFALAES